MSKTIRHLFACYKAAGADVRDEAQTAVTRQDPSMDGVIMLHYYCPLSFVAFSLLGGVGLLL